MLLAPFRLISRVAKRFHQERCGQVAASLAFTTVLGLVPMIAGAVFLISTLPFGSGLGSAVEKFLLANLLPDKAGAIIAKYITQFAHKADRLTWLGSIMLGLTALMQMFTIEHAFNVIWKIKATRPFWRSVLMHSTSLLLGPLIFGASLVGLTFVVSASLGLVEEPRWITLFFFKGVPAMLMVAFFALLYWAVPNRPVVKWHAVVGGIFSAACFAGMQKVFSLYLANFTTYTVIYGTFSAIPIFLIWLYLSWTVILIGAYLVAEMPRATKP